MLDHNDKTFIGRMLCSFLLEAGEVQLSESKMKFEGNEISGESKVIAMPPNKLGKVERTITGRSTTFSQAISLSRHFWNQPPAITGPRNQKLFY
jgi:hypothetical protein